MEYLLSHKKEQNCVISRDVDGLETLIQSKVSQNEERFSDRENRWQAKWNKKPTRGCAKDWMSVSLQKS